MRWPESVAPFKVVIIPSIQKKDDSNSLKAKKIYDLLVKNNIDVLIDDTNEHLSAKFKKFDLISSKCSIIPSNIFSSIRTYSITKVIRSTGTI